MRRGADVPRGQDSNRDPLHHVIRFDPPSAPRAEAVHAALPGPLISTPTPRSQGALLELPTSQFGHVGSRQIMLENKI